MKFLQILESNHFVTAITIEAKASYPIQIESISHNNTKKLLSRQQNLPESQIDKSVADKKSQSIVIVSTPITFECYLCSGQFKCENNLQRHLNTYHRRRNDDNAILRHRCKSCEKSYNSASSLYRHTQRDHMGIKAKSQKRVDSPCEACGKIFASVANKMRHYRATHLGERPFKCSICGATFSQLPILRNHMTCHSDVRKFGCEQCSKTFKTKQHWHKHQDKHLPIDQQKYRKTAAGQQKNCKYVRNTEKKVCEICGKSMTLANLYIHMRKHNGIKPFECTVCARKFSTKAHLLLHSYVHTGERPYVCEYCEKSFSQLPTLIEHRRIHTGEKPYKCAYCDKSFRQSAHLFEHRKTHTGEKPHQCTYCEKSFSSSGSLNEHTRLHTGETPYKCNLCADSYKNLKALRRHAKTMHMGNENEAVTVKQK